MPRRIQPNSDITTHQPKKPTNPSRALLSTSEAVAYVAKRPLENIGTQIGADWKKPKSHITKKHEEKTTKKTEQFGSRIQNL